MLPLHCGVAHMGERYMILRRARMPCPYFLTSVIETRQMPYAARPDFSSGMEKFAHSVILLSSLGHLVLAWITIKGIASWALARVMVCAGHVIMEEFAVS